MSDIISLGGNIELFGAGWIDPASMIVLKKIVGNYVREFSQKTGVQKLSVSFSKQDSSINIISALITTNNSHSSECSHSNLFICLDESLKNIGKEL